MKTVVIAYIPVLHRGYLEFFRMIPANVPLFIISEDLIGSFGDEFDYLKRKDALRAIPSFEMVAAVQGLSLLLLKDVKPLDQMAINILRKSGELSIICPDEDITRAVVERYLSSCEVEYQSIFLRWHRDNVAEKKSVESHRSIAISDFDREMMDMAKEEASKSFDWWRQVGGVLVKDNKPLLIAHNQHVPDEQMPAAFGDPRGIFKRGIHLELTTADHAEAVLIAEAARQGISTKGAWLYVTTFPCPTCAMLVARSGISKVFFSDGYALLDGEKNLKGAGVELVYIEINPGK